MSTVFSNTSTWYVLRSKLPSRALSAPLRLVISHAVHSFLVCFIWAPKEASTSAQIALYYCADGLVQLVYHYELYSSKQYHILGGGGEVPGRIMEQWHGQDSKVNLDRRSARTITGKGDRDFIHTPPAIA